LRKIIKKKKIAIAFPDDGAAKRFGNKFNRYPLVICNKIRENYKRIVKIKEGNEYLKGSHVFIVDDLVKTGGTLIECKNALLASGAERVSAYVTHAVFPQESWKKFTENKPDQFASFYITDSCPEISSIIKDKPPFRLISLANSIARNIMKF